MQHWLQMKHYQLLDDQTGMFAVTNNKKTSVSYVELPLKVAR